MTNCGGTNQVCDAAKGCVDCNNSGDCAAASCSDDAGTMTSTATAAATCNTTANTCTAGGTTPCGAFKCGATTCKSSCTVATQVADCWSRDVQQLHHVHVV